MAKAQRVLDGWYGLKVVDGSEIKSHPGARPGMPFLLATKRKPRPSLPDVRVVMPLSPEVCRLWKQQGEGAALAYLHPTMELAVEKVIEADVEARWGG